MSSSRVRGLSTRVSDATYSVLSQRAGAEGVTLSTLAAKILEQSAPSPVQAAPKPGPAAVAPDQVRAILERLQNLEALGSLPFAIMIQGPTWDLEALPCPRCGELGLQYVEFLLDGAPSHGFGCVNCEWRVTLEQHEISPR